MDRGNVRFLQRIFLLFMFMCAFLYSILYTSGPCDLSGVAGCTGPIPSHQPVASRSPRSVDDRLAITAIVVTLALPADGSLLQHPDNATSKLNATAVNPDPGTRRRHLHSKLKRAAKMGAEPGTRARFLLNGKKLFQKSDKVSIGGGPGDWDYFKIKSGPRANKLSKPEMLTKLKNLEKLGDSERSQQRTVYAKNASDVRDAFGKGVPVPRRENATSQRRLPRALIIGVKKGGTRALLEFIRLHPDVRAVGPEAHFFDRHFHKGLDWYRQQMPPTLESQLTMEKTPSYFVTREVPHRIRDSMDRDIKLLVVVRDPVTRAISDYAQTVSKRRHMKSFDELAFLNNATGLVDTSWGAIKIGVYARHLEHWLQCFPLKQFHFVSGERLIKDPAGEMAKVQAFLGIRQIVTENHFYFNETKGFPCLKKSEGNGSPRCLGKTKGRTHPLVDNSTIQNLRDFFRPFNVKFYQMTGVDFGWP